MSQASEPIDTSPDSGATAAVMHGSARMGLDAGGMLAVSGADAADFLHGQFSSNIRDLAEGEACLTSYSDARGRVLAVPYVIAEADRFLLHLPADRIEPVRTTLAKYVLRADVRMESLADGHACFGVSGHSASVALAGAAERLPPDEWTSARTVSGASIVRWTGPRSRWFVHGPPEAVAEAWDALDGHATIGTADDWRLLEIEAGIPSVYAATAGHFVAQMLNLDRLGAVDFSKGCYPGQEVIARTHYLGRIKRRMFILRCDEDAPAAAGAPVFAGDAEVGEIVDAAAHPDGGQLALAVLRLEASDRPLALGAADGPGAVADDPPYRIGEAA